MESSQTLPILINLGAAFLGAFGQYAYKVGALRLKEVPLYLNWQIFIGMVLFIGVMVMFIIGFKQGGKLSVTYPMYATTFIWGTLLGVVIDKEVIVWPQVFGIGLVVLGISVIAYYSQTT